MCTFTLRMAQNSGPAPISYIAEHSQYWERFDPTLINFERNRKGTFGWGTTKIINFLESVRKGATKEEALESVGAFRVHAIKKPRPTRPKSKTNVKRDGEEIPTCWELPRSGLNLGESELDLNKDGNSGVAFPGEIWPHSGDRIRQPGRQLTLKQSRENQFVREGPDQNQKEKATTTMTAMVIIIPHPFHGGELFERDVWLDTEVTRSLVSEDLAGFCGTVDDTNPSPLFLKTFSLTF